MSKTLPVAGGACAVLLAFGAAQAARADGGAPPVKPARAGAEIIVTATRRASPIASTPIAATIVDAQDARNGGVTDIRQLAQLVSSWQVYSTGSEANAVARVRGVGTVGDNPGLESSVGLFVDGVYRPRVGAALTELGEIERIEMLRGPQGTLFGRNSSAGLVNIVTRAPDFAYGASGEITHGNYNLWRLAARVTGPITDRIAFSIDGVSVKRDGYLTVVDGAGQRIGDTNNRDRYLLRGQLLLKPTDTLSIRLIGDYSQRDESCCGAVYRATGEYAGASPTTAQRNASNRIVTILQSLGGGFPNGRAPDPRDLTVAFTPGHLPVSRVRDWGLSGEFTLTLPDETVLTGVTAYRDYWSSDYGDQDYGAADLVYRDPNTYREFKTFSQELRAQGKAFGGRFDWLVGAYYAHETLALRDDLRSGDAFGQFAACRLMAGIGAAPSPLIALTPNCAGPTGLGALSAQLRGAGLPAPVASALSNGLATLADKRQNGDLDAFFRQKSDNIALFTHDIVHLTRRLDLTLGLRYTAERKSFTGHFDNDNVACPILQNSGLPAIAANPALGSASALAGGILTLGCLGNSSSALNALALNDRSSHDQLTGTAILSWRPTDRVMLYASYARGYKAGGYNLDRFALGNEGIAPRVTPLTFFSPRSNADAATLRFDAETVNAFELGMKAGGERWSVALTGFRQLFSSFQLNTFNGTGFVVQNINGCSTALMAGACAAGHVTAGLISQGFELDIGVNPVRDVAVRGSLTYADTRFADRLVGSSDGREPLDPALFLLPGQQMFNAPDLIMTASATWTPPLGARGHSALLHVNSRMVGDSNAGADLYPEKAQDGYVLLGARIGVRGPGQRWALEFWGQNLLDTRYAQVIFNSPLQSSGPNNQSRAQINGTSTVMANQLFSAFVGEPRTYGLTLRWKI